MQFLPMVINVCVFKQISPKVLLTFVLTGGLKPFSRLAWMVNWVSVCYTKAVLKGRKWRFGWQFKCYTLRRQPIGIPLWARTSDTYIIACLTCVCLEWSDFVCVYLVYMPQLFIIYKAWGNCKLFVVLILVEMLIITV
jgi:hypothetical protein